MDSAFLMRGVIANGDRTGVDWNPQLKLNGVEPSVRRTILVVFRLVWAPVRASQSPVLGLRVECIQRLLDWDTVTLGN